MKIVLGIASAASLIIAAQNAPQPDGKKPLRADAGEIICQQVKEIGSRLIVKKVCMTRLQWQEQKTADRVFTEGVQSQLGALRDGG